MSQSWQLLDTWWIDRECSCLLDSFSTPGGSIELLFLDSIPCCSILARYLSYQQAFSRHLPQQLPRHLICRALLKVLFKPPHVIRFSFHSISLSIALCFLSQTFSSHSNLNPQRFLQDFSRFSSLGKLLISHSSCISCFETYILGFFKIVELFLKIWDGFSLKWV